MSSRRIHAVLYALNLIVFAGVSSCVMSSSGLSAKKHGLPVAGPNGGTMLLADGGGPLPNPIPIPSPWSSAVSA